MFFFYFRIIFFKIFGFFLTGNAKVNMKYSYGQEMVGFHQYSLPYENFIVYCSNDKKKEIPQNRYSGSHTALGLVPKHRDWKEEIMK